MRMALACCAVLVAASTAVAQNPAQAGATSTVRDMGGGNCPRVQRPPRDTTGGRGRGGGAVNPGNEYNCSDAPNPLPAPNTIWFEEMTWMDVRDALTRQRES